MSKAFLYFSVYETAKKTAEEIAKQTGADLMEIEPAVPYDNNRIIITLLQGLPKKKPTATQDQRSKTISPPKIMIRSLLAILCSGTPSR